MNDFFDKLNDHNQKMFSPMSKINELVLNNLSELLEIQTQALGAYTDLGMTQAKAAMEIRDAEAFSTFLQQQANLAKTMQEQFKGDMEKVTELANKFSRELGGTFKEDKNTKPSPAKASKSSKASKKSAPTDNQT